MSVSQLSIVLDKKFRARLKHEADRKGVSVSQLARAILTDGVERISGRPGYVPLSPFIST